MSVMSSLWSSHLAGWPWGTITEGGSICRSSPPLHLNLQLLFWYHSTSRDHRNFRGRWLGAEQKGVAEGRGGGDLESGGKGRAARVEEDPQTPQRGAFPPFLPEATHQNWHKGTFFFTFPAIFRPQVDTHTSEEDFHYILTDVLGKMEETLFGAVPLSSRKVRGNFFYSPGEKSAVLTVTTLLACNVFDIGGTVAVPQKCRLTQIGE